MAEDKKPNLKDRLKKTTAAAAAPAGGIAPPGGVAAPMMPPVSGPTSGTNSVPPPPVAGFGIPGIPGLGGDVAPPAFVQQQQAAEAARQRAVAAASDPFGSAVAAPAGPQEVRLVIDERPVDAKEVGRNRAGLIIAIVVTGVLGLGGGYAVGGLMEVKNQEHQTLSAVTNVRNEVTRLGDVINSIKTHVDHAVETGNITVQRDDDSGGQAAPPTHPPDVDDDLITWFQQQPSDPPFSPDVYAGRVGRLRSQVVSKLTVVQLQFNEAWRQLGVLSRMNPTAVRTSMNSVAPANNPLRGAVVTFVRPQPDGPILGQLVTAGQADAHGIIPISGLNIPANQTRTAYQTGPITEATLPTFAFLLAPNAGLAPQIVTTAAAQWNTYRQRVSDLKQLVDQLVQNQQQLLDQLTGHAGS